MFDELRRHIDDFLTGPMLDGLSAVDYVPPAYGCSAVPPQEALRAKVKVGHISGSPEARYLLDGFGEVLEIYIQLNVYRLVVVYRIPLAGALDSTALQPRFGRWEIGANDAGWKVGWRDTVDPTNNDARHAEIYCYASLPHDFLSNEYHQLYWINDVVQMTRALLLEAKRFGVRLPWPASG